MKKIELVKNALEAQQKSARSQWLKGVYEYALELLEQFSSDSCKSKLENLLETKNCSELKTLLLNGAESWSEYSWGGCSLIYDGDICERLATPSEQKRCDYGRLNPNKQEQWLDTQARALFQAFNKIKNVVLEC